MRMKRGPGLFRGVMAVGVTTGLVGAYRSGQENPTPKSAARTMLARQKGWRPQEHSTGLRLDQGPPHFYLSLFPDARDTGTNAIITMKIDEQTFVLFTVETRIVNGEPVECLNFPGGYFNREKGRQREVIATAEDLLARGKVPTRAEAYKTVMQGCHLTQTVEEECDHNSMDTIRREVEEETGLVLNAKNATFDPHPDIYESSRTFSLMYKVVLSGKALPPLRADEQEVSRALWVDQSRIHRDGGGYVVCDDRLPGGEMSVYPIPQFIKTLDKELQFRSDNSLNK